MEVTGHSKENIRLSEENWVLVLTLVSFDRPYLVALFSSFLEIRGSIQSVVLNLFWRRISMEISWSYIGERQSKQTLSRILQEQLFYVFCLKNSVSVKFKSIS